jgi:hypothetical protein
MQLSNLFLVLVSVAGVVLVLGPPLWHRWDVGHGVKLAWSRRSWRSPR